MVFSIVVVIPVSFLAKSTVGGETVSMYATSSTSTAPVAGYHQRPHGLGRVSPKGFHRELRESGISV